MKIFISVSNYVDTVDVIIDGVKIDKNKLSFFSKAKFERELEGGVHEITVTKGTAILGHNWKKSIIFDWLSCLSGLSDWTVKEKVMDQRTCSINIKVNVEQDVDINIRLTEDGFELIQKTDAILTVDKEIKISEQAKQRIKNAYIIPAIILATVIGLCMLIVGILFLMNNQYAFSIILLAMSISWVWLIYNSVLNKKSKK